MDKIGDGGQSLVLGSGDATQTAWGVQKVSEDRSLFHGLFSFDVPPTMWLVEEDGVEVQNATSTRVTSNAGALEVYSGLAGSSALAVSRRHVRYQPNRGLIWSASMCFQDASSDGVCRAGLLVEEENGVYFKTKGDGILYACVRSGGVEIKEEAIIFPFYIDITKGNIYDIQMQWRGVGNIKFFAGNPATGTLELVHVIKFLNTLDAKLSIENPAFSTTFGATAITEPVTLWVGCVDITAEGGTQDREQYASYGVEASITSGDPILAMYNPLLVNAKPNTRDIRLARITVSADKKASIDVYSTRNATAIVGGTFIPANGGSFVEINETIASVDLLKMRKFFSFLIPALGTLAVDNPARETIDFFVSRGDYLVLVCNTATGADISATIEWGDEI